MINPRTKGKAGEREVLLAFVTVMTEIEAMFPQWRALPRYSEQVKRNSLQTADGGFDIYGLPGIGVEVKRCETLNVNAWWQQAVTQAAEHIPQVMPVLIYRQSRKPWQVQTWAALQHHFGTNHPVIATMQFTDFIEFYRAYYRNFLLDIHRREQNLIISI